MPQNAPAPRPNLQVAARVEELLREQLEELGVNPRTLAPEDIAANMHFSQKHNNTYDQKCS